MNIYQLTINQTEGSFTDDQALKSTAILLAYGELLQLSTSYYGGTSSQVSLVSSTDYDMSELNESITEVVKSQNSRKSPVGIFKATYERGDFIVVFDPTNEVRSVLTNTVSVLTNDKTLVLMGNITDTQSEISNVLRSENAFILNS